MKRTVLLLIFFLGCSLVPLDERTAALVNGEAISVEELRNNMHFMTLFARNEKGRALVDAHLDLLIDKKLFAQEGKRLGLEHDPVVRQVVDWAERDQMIKALYRDEVYNKVQPSEAEIRAAFFRGREQVRLRHLFARSEVEAMKLKEELDKGVDFNELAARTFRDSTLRRTGGDLGFVGYDDIDERLAEAAFALPQGETSGPVRSRYGWHILRVDGRRQQIFNPEAEYGQQREAIAADLRRSREKQLAGAWVERMMSGLDVKMINATFDILAASVQGTVLGAERMIPNYQPILGSGEMERITQGTGGQEAELLVTWKGGEWTLGDFLRRVAALPVSERPRIDTPGHLRFDIGKQVMREMLVQEAKRRKLDQDPQVLEGVGKWRDEYLFGALWQKVRDTLRVSPAEERAWFASHQGRYRELLPPAAAAGFDPDSLAALPRLQQQVQEDLLTEKSEELRASRAAELRRKARIRRNEAALEALAREFPRSGERIDIMGVPNK